MSTKKTKTDNIDEAEIVDVNFDVTTDANYSPFDEPVKERAYTKPNVEDASILGDIEEPTFEAPSFSDLEAEYEEESESEPSEPFNPSYNELGKKEKKMGAEMVAEVVLDGYDKLGTFMGSLAKINEGRLEREFAEGNIDPNTELPIDDQGNTVPIREFVKEFNETSKDAFATSEEFKEKVKPPLVRIFEKRGIGMTDEQLLAYYFGTDIAQKGIALFGLRKTGNEIINQLKEQNDIMRQPIPSTPPPAPKPEPPSPTVVEQTENFEEPEEVFEVQPKNVKNNKSGDSNFAESKMPDNMPTFGDPKILNEAENIARQNGEIPVSTPQRKRGRPKRSK